MFKVIIIFLFSTSFLYGKLEISGGYDSSSRSVHCDNGEDITDPKGAKLEVLFKIELLKDIYIDIGTSISFLSEKSTSMNTFMVESYLYLYVN